MSIHQQDFAQPLLAVQGLTKRYRSRIGCTDVSFDLYPGEVLGVVGESGSGKSTVLSCHLRPDRGRCAFDGCDVLVVTETERRRVGPDRLGLCPQNPRDGLRMGSARVAMWASG
jgi:putative phosphonate transport system ATP-binding protein